MKYILIAFIRIYQRFLSPAIGGHCRFYPTCSEYLRQSLIKWGCWRGLWRSIIRISKCHPFHPGGYDPV